MVFSSEECVDLGGRSKQIVRSNIGNIASTTVSRMLYPCHYSNNNLDTDRFVSF